MVMAAFLVLAMTATTFLTQRQLMSKNMPADALTGPYAQQQKFLLFVLPLVFAVGGIAFPIGVLLYWTTSNLWTMGQQFYVIRNNPAPGTPAFAAKEQRDAAKAARHGTRRAGGRAPRPAPPTRSSRSARRSGSSPSGSRASSARSRGRARRRAQASRNHGPTTPRPRTRSSEDQTDERAGPGRDRAERPGPRVPRVRRVPEDAEHRGTEETDAGDEADAPSRTERLENEGDIAADYLEELLDIADLDGDLDMDVDGDRASVSIVGAELQQLVGRDGEVLDALQELTRLAVYRETGERSRLMLDISGYRAGKREELVALAERRWRTVKDTGESVSLDPMSPFERKVVHDAVAAAGLSSESEGVEPKRYVVVLPA